MYEMLDNSTRKRFVKDFKLPIQLFQGDYFEYFINLYDSLLGTKEKAYTLCSAVEECKGSEGFKARCLEIQETILQAVKETEAYNGFQTENMDKYKVVPIELPNSSGSGVLKSQHVGKDMVSIDMAKANFQVFSKYFGGAVFNTNTYADFLSLFIDSNTALYTYLLGSKGMRQYIFGNLNPKRQSVLQKHCIHKLLTCLVEERAITSDSVNLCSVDEIVVEGNVDSSVITQIATQLGLNLTIKHFKLEHFYYDGIDGYVQRFSDGSERICGVPSVFFAQVYRHHRGQPITKYDKQFLYEGRIAEFCN